MRSRCGTGVAAWAGIRLGGPESAAGLGAFRTVGIEVVVDLSIGPHRWRAPVLFCEPWPLPFALLGQQTFLQYFDVRIRGREQLLELEPAAG